MSLPTQSDVHVDAILTDISTAYTNANFISRGIFPVVRVAKASDKYFTFTKDFWFRDEAEVRAAGAEFPRGGYAISTATYSTDQYAFEKAVPDEVRMNADNPLAPDTEATLFVAERLRLKEERQFAADFFTTSVWGTDKTLSGTSQWSDGANSDPVGDIDTGKSTIAQNTGRDPNVLVMGRQVFDQLRQHPDILDRIKYVQKGITTIDVLASVFGVEQILVGNAIRNTAAEGVTFSGSFIWGKNALLLYVPASAGLMVPSAGYTFVWEDMRIETYRDERVRSDVVRGLLSFDQKLVGKDLGYFVSAAVA